jgi:hypothetical protein
MPEAYEGKTCVAGVRRRRLVSRHQRARVRKLHRAAGLCFELREPASVPVRAVVIVVSVVHLLVAITTTDGNAPHRLAHMQRHAGRTRDGERSREQQCQSPLNHERLKLTTGWTWGTIYQWMPCIMWANATASGPGGAWSSPWLFGESGNRR